MSVDIYKEITEARGVLSKYNALSVRELCDMYFQNTGKKFTEDQIYSVQFTGLNSTDCLLMLIAGFNEGEKNESI